MRLNLTPIAATLLVCCLAGITAAQQQRQAPADFKDSRELPDTPAVKRAQELFKVLQAGDEARLRTLVESSFAPSFLKQIPMEEHVSVLYDFSATAKHLKLHGVRSYDPPRPQNQAVLIFSNSLSEGWEALVVTVEEQAPHRILGLEISRARPPSDLPPPEPISQEEAVSKFRQYLQRLAGEGMYSGTVLLASHGRVLYEGASGEADRNHGVPNDIDTKFNLGSMNKMFTAVAVAQLVEQGKLSFDDPISKYLDESWLPREITDKVQLKHLLTHTSGLGSYFNEQFMQSSRLRYREVDDYKPLVKDETLEFEPGTQSRYSNTGFLLLGAIIEKASGQNYFDYIGEHIYEPAGMSGTDSYDIDTVVEDLAVGYFREGGKVRNNTLLHVVRGGPAGGGYSTVRDLHRFAQALLDGKLISASMRETLWTPKPELSSPTYGYGFGIQQVGGETVVGHNGGFPGISADLAIFTQSGYIVAAMSNDGSATDVTNRARSLIDSIRSE